MDVEVKSGSFTMVGCGASAYKWWREEVSSGSVGRGRGRGAAAAKRKETESQKTEHKD